MRKGWWRLWFPHKSGWDSGLNKKKKRRGKKEKAQIKKRKEKKKKKKREKRHANTTFVLQSSTMFFHVESLLSYHFHILVGIFIIELGLYIPMMGFLKCPRSSWASKLDAHPLSFSLSFHTLIALVHPLHGNPYSSHWHQLMGMSIARWLAALVWDFLIFLYSLYLPLSSHSIPPVVLYPWLALMYCVRVEKVEAREKVRTNCLACHRVVHDKYFVLRRQSMTRLYDFVGIAFFNVDILKDTIVCWDAWDCCLYVKL